MLICAMTDNETVCVGRGLMRAARVHGASSTPLAIAFPLPLPGGYLFKLTPSRFWPARNLLADPDVDDQLAGIARMEIEWRSNEPGTNY
jgi:hypothetical protein